MKLLQTQYKVILFSVFLGVLVGLIDAIIDHFYLGHGESFWGALIYDVPAFGLYLRFSALLIFIIFGLVAANIINKQKMAEEKFNEMYTREK